MNSDNFLESSKFDRKSRYVKSVNPQEKERLDDLRARFLHAEVMDESLDNLPFRELPPLPTDSTIMKAACLDRKQWDAILKKNRDVFEDYFICHTGGQNYYKRELVGIMKSLRNHLLEAISRAELLKAQAARARASGRGSSSKGCVRTEEQKARMSAGQKARYARARLAKVKQETT